MAEELKKHQARRKRSSNSISFAKESRDQDMSSIDATNLEFQQQLAGIATAMQSMKRKRMEKAITAVAERSVKRLSESVAAQMAEKHMIFEQFYKQGVELLEGYRQDSLSFKKELDELQKLVALRQKCYQQALLMQAEKLKLFDGLLSAFHAGVTELEGEQEKKRVALAKEIEEDVKQLQKSLLAEEHQKDLANMHQSMKAFMFI